MNGEHLTDRIPDVILSGEAWTEIEARHLSQCIECRRELELVEAAAHLGRNLPSASDPAIMAREVLQRLKNQRTARRQGRWLGAGAGLAAAAAVALILSQGGGLPEQRPVPVAANESLSIPLPGLESLGAEDLEVVLNGLESPPADDYSMEGLTWHNPGDPELNRMLHPEEM